MRAREITAAPYQEPSIAHIFAATLRRTKIANAGHGVDQRIRALTAFRVACDSDSVQGTREKIAGGNDIMDQHSLLNRSRGYTVGGRACGASDGHERG